MQFSPDLRAGVADGSITVSIRLWSRPQVKMGGRYGVGGVRIEVDDIELMPFAAISAQDLARSGDPDRDAARRRAAHAGSVHDDTLVCRIEFHVVEG